MADINRFISNKLKEKEISWDEFLKQIEISRATYYRYVNKGEDAFEPYLINKISNVLSLSSEDRLAVFGYSPVSDSSPETSYFDKVKPIFFFESPLDGMETNTEFEYYDVPASGEKNDFSLDVLSASGVARRMISSLECLPDERSSEYDYYHYKFSIKILNCLALDITSLLARLIASIQKNLFDVSSRIKVNHFIYNTADSEKTNNSYSSKKQADSLSASIELLYNTLPLHAICTEYTQDAPVLPSGIWSNSDVCIIKFSRLLVPKGSSVKTERDKSYGERKQRYTHFLIRFNRDDRTNALTAYTCHLGEPLYLYKFFTIDTKHIPSNDSSYLNSAMINKLFRQSYASNKMMLIGNDFCFDSINPVHWSNLFESVLHTDNLQNILNYLKKLFDLDTPFNNGNISISDMIHELINDLKVRYELSNIRRNINIFHAEGIQDFVARRMTSDMIAGDNPPKELHFDSATMCQILSETQDAIKNNDNPNTLSQKIYFVRPSAFRPSSLKYILIEDVGFFSEDDKSVTKNKSFTSFSDTNVVKIMMDYWMSEISKREKSKTPYSQPQTLLMSDEEAIAFLEKLKQLIS